MLAQPRHRVGKTAGLFLNSITDATRFDAGVYEGRNVQPTTSVSIDSSQQHVMPYTSISIVQYLQKRMASTVTGRCGRVYTLGSILQRPRQGTLGIHQAEHVKTRIFTNKVFMFQQFQMSRRNLCSQACASVTLWRIATSRNPIELKPAPESAHRLQRRGKSFDLSFLQIHSAWFDTRLSRFPSRRAEGHSAPRRGGPPGTPLQGLDACW